MEMIKQHITYNITDTNENGWELQGTASRSFSAEEYGINATVYNQGELIGSMTYNKPGSAYRATLNVEVAEENREAFTAYINKIISEVIEYIYSDIAN